MFLLLLLAASVSYAQDAPWQDLIVSTCGNSQRAPEVHFFPSHPVLRTSVSADIARKFYKVAAQGVLDEVQCHCPSMPANTLDLGFAGTMEAVLRMINKDATLNGIVDLSAYCNISGSWATVADDLNISLPSACSTANYVAGNTCRFQWSPTTYFAGTNFKFAIKKCPANAADPLDKFNLPYMSMSCQGAACTDFLQPCSMDSDCSGGSKCGNASYSSGDAGASLYAFLLRVGWTSSGGVSCFGVPGADPNYAHDMGGVILQKALNFISSVTGVGAPAAVTGNVRMCGVDNLRGIVDWIPNLPVYWSLQSFLFENVPLFFLWWPFPALLGADVVNGFPYLQWRNFFYASGEFPRVNGHTVWAHLSAWDGVLANGQAVDSSARTEGTAWPALGAQGVTAGTGDVVSIFAMDCDAGFTVMGSSPGATSHGRLPDLNAIWSWLFDIESQNVDCRANPDLNAQQKNVRYNPFSVEFWLNLVTSHDAYSGGDAGISDLSSYISARFGLSSPSRVAAPAECSFLSYLATGSCTLSYDYLPNTAFAGEDLKIQLRLTKCPASKANGIPKVEIQCVGASCRRILEVYKSPICKQDADCGLGGQCSYLADNAFPNAVGMNLWNANSQQTVVARLAGTIDMQAALAYGLDTRQKFESMIYEDLVALMAGGLYGMPSNIDPLTFVQRQITWQIPYDPAAVGQQPFTLLFNPWLNPALSSYAFSWGQLSYYPSSTFYYYPYVYMYPEFPHFNMTNPAHGPIVTDFDDSFTSIPMDYWFNSGVLGPAGQDQCSNPTKMAASYLAWGKTALGQSTALPAVQNTDRIGFCKVLLQTANYRAMNKATLWSESSTTHVVTVHGLNGAFAGPNGGTSSEAMGQPIAWMVSALVACAGVLLAW